MARVLFGHPVYSDTGVLYTPTLSGGSWEATLPLTNLKDRRLSRVARSTDAAITSTKILIDLGVARPVRLVGLPKHTLSSVAQWRVRGSSAVLTNVAANPQAPNSWTAQGTPVITTGITDPWGGTAAILVEDDDGAASEGKQTTCTFMADATKVAVVAVRAGTLAAINARIRDTTAGVNRHLVIITWNGGTTAPTVTTSQGAGTIYDSVPIYDPDGALWWLVRFAADSVVAANTNAIQVLATGTDTGTFYLAGGEAFNLTGTELLYDAGGPVWPAGLDAEDVEGINLGAVQVFDEVTARFWQIELGDPTNAAGYVDVGRLAICGGWQPTFNLSYGAKLGLETESGRQLTDGGAALYTERPTRRTLVGVLEDLPEDDALANGFDMQRIAGISRQLYVVMDPDDTTHLHRRSFLATWKELSGFTHSHLARIGLPVSLVEEL